MSGFSAFYYRNVRDPIIERLMELRALDEATAVPTGLVTARDDITDEMVQLCTGGGYVAETPDGRVYLDVDNVRRTSLRYSAVLLVVLGLPFNWMLVQLALGNAVITVPVPLLVVVVVAVNAVILCGALLELRPYLLLRQTGVRYDPKDVATTQ